MHKIYKRMLFKNLNDGHYESHKVKTKRVVWVSKLLEMTIAKVIKNVSQILSKTVVIYMARIFCLKSTLEGHYIDVF